MSDLLCHPVFAEAVRDIESLGVSVSPNEGPGANSYATVGGRSSARWWLIPLENGHVSSAGLALFQPLLGSAHAIKALASGLSLSGLTCLWARNRVYISGDIGLASYFPSAGPLVFAYFTGTDSPHRKVTVQIMDRRGNLKGFAKLTRSPLVRKLLEHEAETLEHLNELDLQTVQVPKVLFFGNHGDTSLLVTDTLKTPKTRSTTRFSVAHQAFLRELESKTMASPKISAGDIAGNFRSRFNQFHLDLQQSWHQHLDDAISSLEAHADCEVSACLSHGDFTPWNTFMANGRIYAFDWEYAEHKRPSSNDLIHFVLNQPQLRNKPASEKIENIIVRLRDSWTGISKNRMHLLLTIYLLTLCFRQIERLPINMRHNLACPGMEGIIELFEQLAPIAHKSRAH